MQKEDNAMIEYAAKITARYFLLQPVTRIGTVANRAVS